MGSTISILVPHTLKESLMESRSTLIKCGFVQLCCALSFVLFKILGNNVTYNYKEMLHRRYQDHRGYHFQSTTTVIPIVHVDVAAIVLYALTGLLLLCLSSRTKNLCLVLSVNFATLLSLVAASGLAVFALLAILSSGEQPLIPLVAIVVLCNSLVMLLATIASTMEIWRISFCSSNSSMDSPTTPHVSDRGNRSQLPSAPRSTLQVANERNTTSSQPAAEDDFFQHFTTDGGEEVGRSTGEEQPPPYHIATGRIPCKHCSFTARDKNDFIEHFRRKPDHWSCLACKRGFTTFKDFSRHIVRRGCNQSDGQN